MSENLFKPEGGLNSDTNDRDLPEGDYRMARNCELGLSNFNKARLLTFIRGPLQVGTDYTVPGLEFTCIGTCPDLANNAIIEFIFSNFFGTGYIRRFFKDTETSETVVSGALEFTQELITHAHIVDGMLLWAQKGTYPKKINLEKAKKFQDSNGSDPDGYPFLDYQTIAAGAFPPNFKPDFEYDTVQDYAGNFVNNSTYQFAYYFIYDDNEISQLSPYSLIAAPLGSWDFGGLQINNGPNLNVIRLKFNTGHHKVVRIGFAYRTSLAAPFRVFTVLEKSAEGLEDNTEGSVLFFGNESTSPLPISQRNFDYIPITAEAQAVLPTNNIAYANIETGIDKVKPDVSLSAELAETATLKAFAVNLADQYQVLGAIQQAQGITADATIVDRVRADLWFDSVPPEGTNFTIRMACDTRWIYEDPGVNNPFQGQFYFLQNDGTGNTWKQTLSAGIGFSTSRPLLEVPVTVLASDVSGGLNTFIQRVRDLISDALPDYIDEAQAWLTQINANNAFFNGTVSFGADFLAGSVTTGAYADISSDYDGVPDPPTPPLNIAAYESISDINTSRYVRTEGMVFVYDFFQKTPATPEYPSDPPGLGYVGFYKFDLKTVFTPFYEGDTVKSLKSGTYQVFGLNYYDRINRDSTAVTDDRDSSVGGFRLYIPFFPGSSIPDDSSWSYVVRALINHRPPMGATHYKWVWKGNVNIQSFGWFAVSAIISDTVNLSVRTKITLANHNDQEIKRGEIRHSIQVGDIVRPVIRDTSNLVDTYFDEELELSVISIDDTGSEIVIFVEEFDFATYGLDVNSVVEIYTTKVIQEEGEANYFEVGQEYEIIAPNTPFRAHEGQIQSQDTNLTQPAISLLNFADVWVRRRQYKNGNVVYVEDFHFSDYFPSNMNDRGRISVFSPNAKRIKRPHDLIHGGKYFADTEVNDLFSISSLSTKQVGIEKGPISGIVMSGFVLKVYQTRKANSIYIGRTIASNTDGSDNQFELIDGVFGTIVPSAEVWGCANPESIVATRRYVFFFDVEHGVWIRDANNGLFPISKAYAYNTYWTDKAEEISQLGRDNFKILAAFDERNAALYCCVHAKNSIGKSAEDLAVFHEDSNRWKFHLDMSPEFMASLGNALYFYKDGNTHQMYKGEPGVFFGEQQKPSITFIAGEEGFSEKVFNTISLMQTAATLVEISIPKEYSSSKRDMETRILPSNLQRDESTFHGEIRCDRNTPGYPNETIAQLSGDTMRGKKCIVKVTFEDPGEFEFYSAMIKYTLSTPTP